MVDVNAQVDAVTRGVRTEDVDGVLSRVQTLSQEYPSPIEDVWDAATSADRIPRWFLPSAATSVSAVATGWRATPRGRSWSAPRRPTARRPTG
ncbi:SRPBCC family protein [Microbacterium resistens]|uniref:hypothetical protein n=1 Tax=Microbacterium resistens TaxID=156977 RepID=UPI00366A5C9F